MTVYLKGVGVSRGFASSLAHVLADRPAPAVPRQIDPEQLGPEQHRYHIALATARTQLIELKSRLSHAVIGNVGPIIDMHIMLLDDEAFTNVPAELIESSLCSAEWALLSQRESLVAVFDEIEDTYLKNRREDIIAVSDQIMNNLTAQTDLQDNMESLRGKIVVAHSIPPTLIALMHQHAVQAVVSVSGSTLSHAAIIARGFDLPFIAGVRNATLAIRNDDHVIVDGETGAVIIEPSEPIETYYQGRQKQHKSYLSRLNTLIDKPCVTRDRTSVQLLANADELQEVEQALTMGTQGIGLFRTEMLFLDRDSVPEEDEQLDFYLGAVRKLEQRPLIIRTLDIDNEKWINLVADSPDHSNEPSHSALGLRGLRLCLKNLPMFRKHLRAILRASAEGDIRLMLPMLSSVGEVIQVKQLLADIKQELRSESLEFNPNIQLGGMIEIPAAAVSSYELASMLDFISIGTNDLIQYTLAMDRTNADVEYLYDPFHPAIIRLIYFIIKSCERAHTPVTLCGEMAGEPRFTRLLLALGLRSFSTHWNYLLEIKNAVRESDIKHCRSFTTRLLRSEDSAAVKHWVDELNT